MMNDPANVDYSEEAIPERDPLYLLPDIDGTSFDFTRAPTLTREDLDTWRSMVERRPLLGIFSE